MNNDIRALEKRLAEIIMRGYELRAMLCGAELRYNPYHDPKTGRFCSGDTLDNGGRSGIINNRNCVVHPDKVNKFFLKPGAKHSKEFFDVGYTVNDGDKLTKDLSEIFDYSKAVDKSVSNDSVEKFSIFAELGVSEKKRFRTVWQKDTPDGEPRIITAHRED